MLQIEKSKYRFNEQSSMTNVVNLIVGNRQ
jgi:hypothetical protein